MDSYDEYMRLIDIRPVPESWRAVDGQRPPEAPDGGPAPVDVARGSFVQLNIAVTVPRDTIVLTERRPAFFARLPVDAVGVLRADLDAGPFTGKIFSAEGVRDDDGVARADVLTEAQQFVPAWRTLQLVCLADIPPDAAPGEYEMTARFYSHTMFYDERLAREIRWRVRVREPVIPRGGDRTFYLNLWQHIFNIARKAEVAAYTDAHIEALRPYCRALGELGCRWATVLLSDVPWAGQGAYSDYKNPSDLFEYNYVRVKKTGDGRFECDFSFAEKYIALMREYGADRIMLTGLHGIWTRPEHGFSGLADDWPDAIRVSYVDEADGCIRFMRTRAEIEWYISAVYRWLRDTDRLSVACLMGDEVDLPGKTKGWTDMLATLHRLMPGIAMEWDNEPASMRSPEYAGEPIDVYTPGHNAWAQASEEDRQAVTARLREGGHMLWSTCCWPPLVNSFLVNALTEVRLHGLITEKLGMEGFLRWDFTVWPEDPRKCLPLNGWPAGDTCFVYPGRGGQCLLSLRYLALRRGIEDFELCRMVRSRRRDAQAVIDRALGRVIIDSDMSAWDYETWDESGRRKYFSGSDADFQAARAILIDALEGADRT